MNSSYEQKHPLYAASFTKRRKAMDLYEGGERIEGNRAYLTRHTYESDKQYDIRASRPTATSRPPSWMCSPVSSMKGVPNAPSPTPSAPSRRTPTGTA